jgi:hypothetical protein
VLENLTRLRPRAQQDIPSLIKRGLLAENEGTYALFSPSFARWISREITAPAEEAEKTPSVEAWLKEGGHERLQPIKGVLPTFKKKYWPLVTTILHEFSFEFAAGGALELAKLLIV